MLCVEKDALKMPDDLERVLSRSLYRVDCPAAEALGEYQLDLLDAPEREQVARHVALCPHCAEEVAGLGRYLRLVAADLAFTPAGRVRVIFAVPLLAGQEDDDSLLHYRAEDAQIILALAAQDGDGGHFRLAGRIEGAPSNLYASLCPKTLPRSESVLSADVAPSGEFAIESVPQGMYELSLQGTTVEYRIDALWFGSHPETG